jgi:putative sterol carrier protein
LRRYGYKKEAATIAQAMIEASGFFNYRLPEAFAGYRRAMTHYPAEYPTACSPQAWASGAPMLLLRAILGLDVRGSLLEADPILPPAISKLQVRGIPGRWGRTDVSADAADALMGALGAAAAEAPVAVRDLFAAMAQRLTPATTKDVDASIRFDLTEGTKWRIGIDHGHVAIEESEAPADCVLEMREETLLGVLSGTQNARTALLSGKVKVHGDLSIATRFARFVTSESESVSGAPV